jgi:hypothetical protein
MLSQPMVENTSITIFLGGGVEGGKHQVRRMIKG